jgi:hypothetical protein
VSEILRLLALVLALGWAPIGTSAQEAADAAPSPAVSRDMVATLSDEQVRKSLLEQLERTPPAEAAGAPKRPWVLTSSTRRSNGCSGTSRFGAGSARRPGALPVSSPPTTRIPG